MTPQEQQMIDALIDRIRNTQLTEKDPEAERYLQQGLANYPDTVYVLAQTVLVQQYGLTQAQQQIQSLQSQIAQLQQQSKPHGSFLGNLLGLDDQPQQPPPYSQTAYAQPQYAPPQYAQPVYTQAQPSFLRSAMQTAAGVAAGEMVFQGMESLFHGFGGGGGYGGYGSERPEVINNYYGEDSAHEHATSDSSFYNPSNDASRDNFAGSSDDQNGGGGGGYDDDQSSGGDDYSSSDDGGGGGGGDNY